MTRPEFLADVAAELRLLGQPYDRGALEAFVAAAWPLVEEDPAAGRWAREFQASDYGMATVAPGGPLAVAGAEGDANVV